MKKEIVIKFDIYQDDLNNQKPEPVLFIETLPEKENSMTIKEINKSKLQAVKLKVSEQKDMSEHLGRSYYCKIKGKLLKDILKILSK